MAVSEADEEMRRAFGNMVKGRMEQLGLRDAELARRLGVSRQAVGQWRQGQSLPKPDKIGPLADHLKIPRDQITFDLRISNVVAIDTENGHTRNLRRVPLLSWVDAGRGAEVVSSQSASSARQNVIVAEKVSSTAFALQVRGDSMEPEYCDGEVIIVDPEVRPVADDCIVAELLRQGEEAGQGDVTFKRYSPRGVIDGYPCFDLIPINPAFDTVTVSVRNPGRIIGTVVEHHRRLRRR